MESEKPYKDASHDADRDALTRLAIRMKRGDRRAASALYDNLLPKVFGFLFVRTARREVAEDLSHDVFVRLIEKIGAFDERRGSFPVWFWQMVRHMLVDFYRKKQEAVFSNFGDDEAEALALAVPGEDLDEKMKYEKLTIFLKTLTPDERELFEYRYVVQMAYREIAELTGRTEGSLRVATLRIKEKIKKELKHA